RACACAATRGPASDDGASLCYLFHGHEVTDLADHAPDLGAIVLHHGVVDPLQPQPADRVLLVARPADHAPALGHLQLAHRYDSRPSFGSNTWLSARRASR